MSVFKCVDDYSQACFDEQAAIGKLLMDIGTKHGHEMLGRVIEMLVSDDIDPFNAQPFHKQPITKSIAQLKRHLNIG